jgi:hypothetical protein
VAVPPASNGVWPVTATWSRNSVTMPPTRPSPLAPPPFSLKPPPLRRIFPQT